MKGYKASNNGKCISLTYVVGKTYMFNGDLIECEQGYHFCENIDDLMYYHSFNKNSVIFEVDTLDGEIIRGINKSVTNKLKIVREIPVSEWNDLFNNNKFDERGYLFYQKHSNGDEMWNEYDENGKLIHYKESNGYWYKKEYNEKGDLVYYKHSQGDEEWYEYDEKGNSIQHKKFLDYTSKEWKEYDDKGNLIHYKDSDGDEEWNEYDDKGNLIKYRNNKDNNWSIEII